jgi:hypothetical protein
MEVWQDLVWRPESSPKIRYLSKLGLRFMEEELQDGR